MDHLAEFKNETTLATICESPESNLHYLLYAIIIDISEPVKHEDCSNYITWLKIIDPSFNYKAEIDNPRLKFHKFAHINIYSETPEEGPKIQCVGDIIRLRRFKFKYTTKGELMGNDVKYSNWLIYSGKKDENLLSSCHKNYAKNKNREFTRFELNRITDLREWANIFFYKNSLKYITWWNDWKKLGDDKNKSEKGHDKVDLILKIKSLEGKNKLFFVDRDQVPFVLQINYGSNL